jgi:hypothetical protein
MTVVPVDPRLNSYDRTLWTIRVLLVVAALAGTAILYLLWE